MKPVIVIGAGAVTLGAGSFVVGIVIIAVLIAGMGAAHDDPALCLSQGIELADEATEAGVPAEYAPLVNASATTHSVSFALLAGLIQQESQWDPEATSSAGAMGLTQLMPETARGLGVTDPFDPAQSIDGGARYLAAMLERFNEVELALAAYNAGPGAVEEYNGIPPFQETQEYVPAVLSYAQQFGGDGVYLTDCVVQEPDNESVAVAIDAARSQLGVPYRWGGNHPSEGFDCSGLMVWAYNQAGVQLPARQSTAMWEAGERVPNPRQNIRPGDLVYWATGRLGPNVSHVAIYIGNDQIIEALTFNTPISIHPMRWNDDFVGATRPVTVEEPSENEEAVPVEISTGTTPQVSLPPGSDITPLTRLRAPPEVARLRVAPRYI